ncbi:GIY-YIG nuclease family protein [Limnohabitans sp. Hippo4]|uniref:GIY-YIG nuclease family protein n=1 Tax=Limnohabitans sp. Hippo4 TaxID=1826167 RepID=UPI000D35B4CE|nr:GIY-YIG nuclease family protein [Limnohabitans sp. Hippo4]PUE35533.1 hypothetical protein B9Z46_10830 [Limnohabitans sp. Hippo4]
MAKLTKQELSILKALGISEAETLDVSKISSKAERKRAANEVGAKVTYGYTPHFKCGYCLKTPSGNCIVCEPKYLAYDKRYQDSGTLYIAYSIEKSYMKVGSTTKIKERSKTLRQQNYGGFSDWVISFSEDVHASAGQIEEEMKRNLKDYKVEGEYIKDGKMQRAIEMFNYPVEKAISEYKILIKKFENKDITAHPISEKLDTKKQEIKALPSKFEFAEQWLHEATKLLCDKFAKIGHSVPKLRVLYGFTTNGFTTEKSKKFRGECLSRAWTTNDENIIFIAPNTRDEVDVLATLGHEIAHAIHDCKSLHGSSFKNLMTQYGYLYDEGFEFPSLKLMFEFQSMAQELGKFPAVSLKTN